MATTATIAWLPWSGAAFARARTERKPVLLSIAPSWCRNSLEMDRSSFADAAVAARVDLRYVAIRVDADRRPDICERYSLGGWPTTAFLTPDGEVLGGGTYVERDRLVEVLERVADAFLARRSAQREGGNPACPPQREARRREPDLPAVARSAEAGVPDVPTIAALVDQVDASFDDEHGGFGGAPKFPHAAPVHLALALFREQGSERHRDIAIKTLDAMGWSPLHDDRDGGFFRYSRNRDWSAPEHEKLLDVNAALLGLYVDAFETLQLSRYAERAEDVLRYVQTWLADPVDGGWGGSQRSDPDYYVGPATGGAVATVAAPPVDRTLYTGWNAAMASAALRAGRVMTDTALSEFAIRSLERIAELCYQPGAGMAHYHDRAPRVRGLLADQIAMAEAELDAFEATGDVTYRMLAEELVLHALRTLWDESGGGFFDRIADPIGDVGLMREPLKPFAANCAAARLLGRVARTCGRDPLKETAARTLAAIGGRAAGAGPLAAELALAMIAAAE
jgi:uncharacterized protein YyaL (SSP411 family)